MTKEQNERMEGMCDSGKVQVDELLVLLSKSKMLNLLYILNCDPTPLRFSELKKRASTSSTTITRRLSELEDHGLVNRAVYPTVPVSVEYSLTADAKALAPSLDSLFEWVLNRAEKVV